MRKYAIVAAGLLVSVVLGATVFSTPLAWAAQTVDATIIGPLDNGNVKVHEEGTANVNVTNVAKVQLAIPAQAFSSVLTLHGGLPLPVLSGPDPAGTNYAITSVTMANENDAPVTVDVFGAYGTTTDCQSFANRIQSIGPFIVVPPHATVHLDFPQAFVISAKAGAASCLQPTTDPAALGDTLTVVGYRF